jgi:signal peptidase I
MKLLKIFSILVVAFFSSILFVGLILTYFQISPTSGHSMEPTSFDGDVVFSSSLKSPKAGDIFIFYCRADRCERNKELLKRLIDIDSNGCIFVQGDNIDAMSHDSRDYGRLCPGEFEYRAVVISIIHRN